MHLDIGQFLVLCDGSSGATGLKSFYCLPQDELLEYERLDFMKLRGYEEVRLPTPAVCWSP